MTTFKSDIYVDAPKANVWAILADLGGIQNFHAGVSKSYYTSEQHDGIGAARVCELLPMGKIEETATEWRDGESYKLNITPLEKAPPFKEAFGRLAVKEEGQGTRVSMEVTYTLKFGPLGKLMNALMIKPRFQKVVPAVLLGLKHYTETGEEITPEVMRSVRQQLRASKAQAPAQLSMG